MNNDIPYIDVSAEKGKFIVKCPYHMNYHLRDIPNKRWSSPKKAYIIPFGRKTAEILSHVKAPISFDEGAIELMANAARPKPKKETFPAWYPFKTKPMKHQHKALDFLWGNKIAALFMAMRTGKTKTTIDWACALHMEQKIDAVVVFCPISVRGSWEAQIAEHAPIEAVVGRYDLTKKSGQKAQKEFALLKQFKFMVVGIESMSSGGAIDYVYDFVSQNGNVLCVVDESHNIKTHNASRTEKITAIGAMCEYRVILTGTPIAASPLDLFGQYRFLDSDIIGFSDFYSFKARYAIMGGYENRQIIGYDNLDELMNDVAPYTFQVNAEEVADLPPKVYMVREVELPAKSRALYDKIKKNSIVDFNGRQLVTSNALDKLTRLSMLTNGVMCTGESGEYQYEWVNDSKIDELMNLIEENPVPTVVWTTGKLELASVVARLKRHGLSVGEIHGSVKEEDRIKNVADFQSGKINYLVANVATGGTGIKLSRARMLVYMSNSFKYVDRKQSEERATDFINVGDSVLIVDIISKNTVDDNIVLPALQSKQDIASFVNTEIGKLKLGA